MRKLLSGLFFAGAAFAAPDRLIYQTLKHAILDGSGRVLVATGFNGIGQDLHEPKLVVSRYLPEGTLDTSWGPKVEGRVFIASDKLDYDVLGVRVVPLAEGAMLVAATISRRGELPPLKSRREIERNFVEQGANKLTATTLMWLSVVEPADSQSKNLLLLMKLLPTGERDKTFGKNQRGYRLLPWSHFREDSIQDVKSDLDGSFVVCGSVSTSPHQTTLAVRRFNSMGTETMVPVTLSSKESYAFGGPTTSLVFDRTGKMTVATTLLHLDQTGESWEVPVVWDFEKNKTFRVSTLMHRYRSEFAPSPNRLVFPENGRRVSVLVPLVSSENAYQVVLNTMKSTRDLDTKFIQELRSTLGTAGLEVGDGLSVFPNSLQLTGRAGGPRGMAHSFKPSPTPIHVLRAPTAYADSEAEDLLTSLVLTELDRDGGAARRRVEIPHFFQKSKGENCRDLLVNIRTAAAETTVQDSRPVT